MKCLECGKETEKEFCSYFCKSNFNLRKAKRLTQVLRRYLFKELPNICQICKYVPPEGLEKVLEFHHISKNEICLLCPTCHREVTILNKRGKTWREFLDMKNIVEIKTINDPFRLIDLRKKEIKKRRQEKRLSVFKEILNLLKENKFKRAFEKFSPHYVNLVARKNNIIIPTEEKFYLKRKREFRICIKCHEKFEVVKSSHKKYCSIKCSNSEGHRKKKTKSIDTLKLDIFFK